ncbi:MAG: GNVR domain-containing protein [Bacteroidales bacterium]|jgi:uncharacterized protein involved in exopolysaccharide biosynthesis
MNLLYFIRLLFKNLLLIFGVALGMAILVYLFTRGKPKTYTSSTTVYTGIATGYDIESGSNARFDLFANNAQFDNLINIIKSRETQEKTAIRLMAQHLLLKKPDPRFCMTETWKDLMSEVPVDIKLMVEKSYRDNSNEENQRQTGDYQMPVNSVESISKTVKDTIWESQTVTERVQRFRVKHKYYTIKAGDSPNAVSEKFGLSTERLRRLNSPMPPFNGGQRIIVGTVSEPYWADTVIQKQVPVIVDVNVPEQGGRGDSISWSGNSRRTEFDQAQKQFSDPSTDEYTRRFNRLVMDMTAYKEADQDNYLFHTLQSSNPYYSVQKISSVKVSRIQSSDLIKLTFDSNDPAVSMQTLKILTDVFKASYQEITTTQTVLVTEYFKERVNAAKKQLDSLEQNLLQFQVANRIINYDEQTKFISEQKETLDRDWYEEAGKFSAAKTALALVESNLGEKGQTLLQNSSLLDKRKMVYEKALQISNREIKDGSTGDTSGMGILRSELAELKREFNRELTRSFDFNRTVDGLNVQTVLQKWLEKAIEVEETQARYKTLTARKAAFLQKYDEFAPLGSQLKKIEREINVAQEDYMNHLNNLNQSIMKQKNVEQSEIQIIDNPVYPLKPNSSKRMIAILAAFMAGLIITASVIILLEFLDTSIKFPGRFEELSGLALIGAFPRLPENPDTKINYPLISSYCIDQITQRIRLEDIRLKDRGDQPFILFFTSTRENEGKTYLATLIVEKLRATGSKVLYIKPLENNTVFDIKKQFTSFDHVQQVWDFEYAVPDNFISIRNINELLRNYSFLTQGYHFLIIELPALLNQEYPATMVRTGQLSILIARATRTWNQADEAALKLYQTSIDHPLLGLLNGCQADHLEPIIGEIPKRRSFFRKWVKKVINLDFKMNKV